MRKIRQTALSAILAVSLCAGMTAPVYPNAEYDAFSTEQIVSEEEMFYPDPDASDGDMLYEEQDPSGEGMLYEEQDPSDEDMLYEEQDPSDEDMLYEEQGLPDEDMLYEEQDDELTDEDLSGESGQDEIPSPATPVSPEDAAGSTAEAPEADDDAVYTAKSEEISFIPGGNADPEELFARYVDSELYPDGCPHEGLFTGDDMTAAEEASYYSFSLNTLETAMFKALETKIRQTADGSLSLTIYPVSVAALGLSERSWTAKQLGVNSLTDGNGISRAAMAAVLAAVPFDGSKVIRALMAAHPLEMYWYNKNSSTAILGWDYRVSGGKIFIDGYVTFSLPVAAEFAADTYNVKAAAGQSVKKAVSKARSIVSSYAGSDDLGKLRGYMKSICSMVSYNYSAMAQNLPYGNPWQLLWVFDGDASTNVVCEGYSKAFQYLCDLTTFSDSRIECLTVTGSLGDSSGSGLHMWNLVRMENGRHYLADITNCDSGSAEPDERFFLNGSADKIIKNGKEYGWHFYFSSSPLYYEYEEDVLSLFSSADLVLSTGPYKKGETFSLSANSGVKISVASKSYTGSPVKPVPVITVDGTSLKNGVDFTVTYSNNVAVGTATAVITGKGSYTGTVRKTFQVKALGSVANAAVTGIVSKVYTGSAQKQNPVVTLNGKTLKLNTDYALSYKTNINVGRAGITITGKGGYTGSLVKYFAINPATVQITGLTAGKKQIKAVWGKRTVQSDGYQLQYSTNKSFKKPNCVITISNVNQTSLTASVQKSGTVYYVRIRTWRKACGKTWLSAWSSVKTVKTK